MSYDNYAERYGRSKLSITMIITGAFFLWVLLLVVLFLNIPACFAKDCISCLAVPGSALVCEGATPFDVLNRCGRPDYRDISGVAMAEKVERWYYNCGEGQFGRVVTIKGGRVISIENTSGRGTGEAKCW